MNLSSWVASCTSRTAVMGQAACDALLAEEEAAFFAALRSTRKAALTASASGKAKATSGARVTITTSCGKRFRYFPRSARPKSYSGCTSLFFLGRLEFLLIAFPLELKIHE